MSASKFARLRYGDDRLMYLELMPPLHVIFALSASIVESSILIGCEWKDRKAVNGNQTKFRTIHIHGDETMD